MDLIQAIDEAVRLLRLGLVRKVLILSSDDPRQYDGVGVIRCDEITSGSWYVIDVDGGVTSSREPMLKW